MCYVAPYDCRVETLKVFTGQVGWPNPGGNYANFALYSGTSQPTLQRWYAYYRPITRGAWNSIYGDTLDKTFWPAGSNIYAFYHQYGNMPNCPSFSADNYCHYPAYSWTYWKAGGGFFNENPGGDWMFRLFIHNSEGVGEWLSYTPIEPELSVQTISRGQVELRFSIAEPSHVRLMVYDIAGRQREMLVSQRYQEGTHTVMANLDLPDGVYFINMKTDSGFNIVDKLIITR